MLTLLKGDANTDDEETEACGLEGTYEWLLNNFDIDGTAGRIIHNVLEYADRMTGDEQYEFLTEMLDGTIVCLTAKSGISAGTEWGITL